MKQGYGQQKSIPSRSLLFELPLDIGVDKQDVLRRVDSGNLLLSYLNPYAYAVAKSNADYPANLGRFDLVVCDGIGVQVAVEAVFKLTTPVISLDYSGIARDYLQLGADQELRMCLVGAEAEVVNTAAVKIKSDYPGFKQVIPFSGFGQSPIEAKKYILDSKPGLVLAGLGMGKQEAFLLDLVDSGWHGVGICVGGFFDKLAKPQLDYPKWTEKTRLRFLGRLIREPRRLSKRYFVDYQPFIGMYLRHLIGRK